MLNSKLLVAQMIPFSPDIAQGRQVIILQDVWGTSESSLWVTHFTVGMIKETSNDKEVCIKCDRSHLLLVNQVCNSQRSNFGNEASEDRACISPQPVSQL